MRLIRHRAGTLLAGLLMTVGCYHQVVETGLPAGDKKIERPWTPTWIFGIVPAQPIDVRRECTSGVAYVDTQMTFMNGLVSALTIGIFTPRSVIVTCAARSSAASERRIDVASTDDAALSRALELAASQAARDGRGVVVTFPALSLSGGAN